MADQAGRRVEHDAALDLAQAIVLERRARAGQVDDHVGDPQARVKLERPLGIDQLVIINSPLAEVLADE